MEAQRQRGAQRERSVETSWRRIKREGDRRVFDRWIALQETVKRKLEENSSMQDQLQRDEIWLLPETDDERSRIESQINRLENRTPDVDAEWSIGLWLDFFFKFENTDQILRPCLDRH